MRRFATAFVPVLAMSLVLFPAVEDGSKATRSEKRIVIDDEEARGDYHIEMEAVKASADRSCGRRSFGTRMRPR